MVDNIGVLGYLGTQMPENTTKDKVRELIGKGLTVLEVARHLNISPQAVYKHIHRYDIPLPTDR